MAIGSGTSGFGGSARLYSGQCDVSTGGSIDVWGGESTTTSSGAISLCCVNTGLDGGSGRLLFALASLVYPTVAQYALVAVPGSTAGRRH